MAMLDEMQTQWLAVVGEGRAHAMLGLTLRGMCRGNFPTEVLVRILGFSEQRKRFRTPDKGPSWWIGSTNNFLLSCVSQHRVGGGGISSTSSSTTTANAREGDGHDSARLKLDSPIRRLPPDWDRYHTPWRLESPQPFPSSCSDWKLTSDSKRPQHSCGLPQRRWRADARGLLPTASSSSSACLHRS